MTRIVFEGVYPKDPLLRLFMFPGLGKSTACATYVVAESETSATADRALYDTMFK